MLLKILLVGLIHHLLDGLYSEKIIMKEAAVYLGWTHVSHRRIQILCLIYSNSGWKSLETLGSLLSEFPVNWAIKQKQKDLKRNVRIWKHSFSTKSSISSFQQQWRNLVWAYFCSRSYCVEYCQSNILFPFPRAVLFVFEASPVIYAREKHIFIFANPQRILNHPDLKRGRFWC